VRKSHSKQKGESMKRNFFRLVVVSLFAVGFGAAAQAQEPDRLVVNIPYDFVVSGKTLPAGKYDVKRNSESESHILSISNAENRVYIVTLPVDVNYLGQFRPVVTLRRIGDQNFLTKIQTAEHVFTIPNSEAAFEAAAAKLDQANYLSGTSESSKR
jgi:hypothetical protein